MCETERIVYRWLLARRNFWALPEIVNIHARHVRLCRVAKLPSYAKNACFSLVLPYVIFNLSRTCHLKQKLCMLHRSFVEKTFFAKAEVTTLAVFVSRKVNHCWHATASPTLLRSTPPPRVSRNSTWPTKSSNGSIINGVCQVILILRSMSRFF